MKARLTAWLSLLLVFSAAFGAPVTTAYTNRVSCCYVYSEQRKHRSEQIAEVVERPRTPNPEVDAPAPPEPETGTLLDFSLFQRPPPALSC